MVRHISSKLDEGNKQLEEYKNELAYFNLTELVKEFFSYIDYTEELDSGRVFHPITIGSCRVMLSEALTAVIEELRKCI